MTEPARPLRVVPDFASGEIPHDAPSYGEALKMLKRAEGRIRGLDLQIDNLKAELSERQRIEPKAEEVREVLGFWADRVLEDGWWSLRPRFDPGDVKWKATRAAMNKGYDAPYLRRAVDGALFEAGWSRKHNRRYPRHWLQPQTIFGSGQIDTHYENALDPKFEWVRKAREVPATLRERWASVELQGDVCMAPGCNHLRLDHDRPRPLEGVFDPPCAVHGCACGEFCDTVERWVDSRERIT